MPRLPHPYLPELGTEAQRGDKPRPRHRASKQTHFCLTTELRLVNNRFPWDSRGI